MFINGLTGANVLTMVPFTAFDVSSGTQMTRDEVDEETSIGSN